MKRIYIFLSAFLFCFLVSKNLNAQILEIESFEAGGSFPSDYPGWDTGLPPFSIVEGTNPCDGNWSLEVPLFTNNPLYLEYISPDLSAGYDIDISFQYDIIDNSSNVPVTGDFGSIELSYTTDGGSTWTIFDTIDQGNVPTLECSEYSFTLPSTSVPANSDFGIRLDATWNTGDYMITVDDFRFIEQVDCIQPVNVVVDESSVTYTEASVSWEDLNIPSSGDWTVGYCIVNGVLPDNDPIGFCDTVNVTGTPGVDLSGLTQGQEYYLYIKSNCGGNGDSEWSAPVRFQTLAIGSTCDVPVEINTVPSNPMPGDLPFQDFNETEIFGNYISGFPGGSCGVSSSLLDGYEVVYRYVSDTDDILTIDLTDLDAGVSAGVFVYEDCGDIGVRCIGGASSANGNDVNLNSVFVDQGEDYYIVIASSNVAGEPMDTSYRLYVDGFDCASWEQPDTDAILQFVSGQDLSGFSNSPMGVTTTISGASLTWYEDNGGAQGQEITSPLNTIALQNGDSFWVSQNLFGCESPLVQVTFDEFNCDTDLTGVTASQGAQVCDEGSVTLNAAAGTDNLFWYDSETDGELIGSGTSFTTPSITESTSYWVSEGFVGLTELASQGNPGPTSSSSSTSSYGLTFEALQPFDIVSVQVYVTGASGILSLDLENENGVVETANVYVVGGSVNNPTLNTINLFWEVAGTGTYRIVKSSGPSMLYESSGNANFPYALGDVGSITSGATTSSTSSSYYYFFNWTITNPAILCETSRTEVEAVVNDTEPILVNTSSLYVCLGDSATLDASSNDQDYTYQWQWSDGSGAHSDTGASIEVDPIENTTYSVTGTNPNTGCNFTEEIEVLVTGVSEIPIALSQANTELCLDDVAQILGGGASYNFEETVTGWTSNNQSTSEIGNAATANWELVQSPGPAGITSNDGSQFYLTRGDLLGPGGVSNSALESPSINLVGVSNASLNFYHYYRDRWNYRVGTQAHVQVSVNQGDWEEPIRTYGILSGTGEPQNEGEPTNFAYESIDLSDYVNYSDVRIRFVFQGDWGWYWAIDNVVIEKEYLNGEITWSPVTDLFFDEEGTMPYDGTVASNVYFNSSTAGQYTYTATLSYDECNDVSETITFDVADPGIPQGDANQIFNLGETIGDLEVTGSNLTWYIMNSQGQLQQVSSNVLLQDGETFYVTQTIGSCESEYFAITTTFECPIPEGIDIDLIVNDESTADAIISWEDPIDVEGIVDYHVVILDSTGNVLYDEYISSEESFIEVEGLLLEEEFSLQIYSVCNYNPENLSPEFELSFTTQELSLNQFEDNQLSYYPNPTKNVVFFESEKRIDSLEVYSITGQRVFHQSVDSSLNSVQVDFSNLASGTYFVNLSIENKEQVIRIIRE